MAARVEATGALLGLLSEYPRHKQPSAPVGGFYRLAIPAADSDAHRDGLLIQCCVSSRAGWTRVVRRTYAPRMRVLTHIKKLDDDFADFLVDVECNKCRRGRCFTPAELAPRVGWQCLLVDLAPRLVCSHCGAKGDVKIVARATPRPRGFSKNPR